ncbi:MAG: O-antigen ligase family protein [Bacteroidota bacterium]
MKKPSSTKIPAQSKQAPSKLKPTYYILLFAYLLIPAYTPNFYTLDTNGPKFVAIAILNLVSFFLFLTDKDFKRSSGIKSGFFLNFIGLAYTLFLAISLLSFFQAINLSESIINFAKISSVFASTYALYIIFSSNRGYIVHVAVALVLVMLFDCSTVFYHIFQYVNKQVDSIYDIKSVYSHKNILSASLFIKIPAAIWLMIYTKGWKKNLGYIGSLLGAIAVLFLSSRAFYLGLAALFIALALFFISRHFVLKQKLSIKRVLVFTGLFVMAVITFSVIQHFLYPVNKDTQQNFNTGVVERLSTITSGESSSNARLNNWKRSFIMIKEHPLLGVGSGNWKLQVLKYEAPTADNFIISYKNHDDFIEVTAETGVLGGLIYLSIFVLIFLQFIKAALRKDTDEENLKFLFLPAFGILAYSFDALFNFPNDRPEIQALFALYVAMGIAFSSKDFSMRKALNLKQPAEQKSGLSPIAKVTIAFTFMLLCETAIILYMNALSLHYQRFVYQDQKANKYSQPSSFFSNGFPSIPNLSCDGAPINTYLARYLINENRSDEAVSLLLKDKVSPYDGRREYYLSMAYDKLGNQDSSIYWGQKANGLKPLLGNMVQVVSSKLYNSGQQDKANKTIERYLQLVKTNPDAWLQLANQYMQSGNEKSALLTLDSAVKYLPGNENISKFQKSLSGKKYIEPYKPLYDQAINSLQAKKYAEGLRLLNDFINKRPEYMDAYQNRAVCLYYLNQFDKSLADVEKALSRKSVNEAFLINLRGVDKRGLKQMDEACKDFKLAMDQGNQDGATNYQRFCGNEAKK